MKVLKMEVGMLGTNCYIAVNEATGHGVVVDPGGDGDRIVAAIKKEGITIDEVQSGSKDTSQNIDKAKNKDLVINKTSRDIAKRPAHKIDAKAVADDKSLAKEDIKEEDSQNPKEGLQNDQNSSKPAGLSREDALNLLNEKNNKVDYSYMGDENTYSVLKEKGHEGYVFLPNAPTDLGMFVNKNTKEIYYFHPSGYMDIY